MPQESAPRQKQLSHAPTSLRELRDLLAQIQSGQSPLSPGQKTIAALSNLIDNPVEAAVHSISQLADELEVNPSTLTRLAKMLGFPGFSGFQALFQAELTGPRAPFGERANRWLSNQPSLGTLQRVINDELNNLQILTSHLDPEVFKVVATTLAEAPGIRIYGARLFQSLASFNAYCLGLIRGRVGLLSETTAGLAHGLLQMEKGDVLFLIGTAPYTRAARELGSLANLRGIRVVALTDAYSSPLAEHAEHTLIINTSGAFFANNIASSCILSEALLLEVATRLGPQAVDRLREHEKLVSDLGIGLTS